MARNFPLCCPRLNSGAHERAPGNFGPENRTGAGSCRYAPRMSRRELEKNIHLDLSGTQSYGDYLQLDALLAAQVPKSSPVHHDEMLFIIQHQTSELWMKLMVHELLAVRKVVQEDRLEPAFKMLARVGHIQRMLFEQWSVLETLTPNEYLQFRGALGKASGFQSHQYRAIEFLLGNKDAPALAPFAHRKDIHQGLTELLHAPSIYDEYLRHLARTGHDIPKSHLERDFTQPYPKSAEVMKVFQNIYEDSERFWDEYEMCEKLIDVEERFALWRFRHMKTVQRIIGFKTGTGGSSGVAFLRRAMDLTFFPELWDVRTELSPTHG
jgi:tryptophan 2,3-dioxygenase